jgi:hypothetical protein
MKRFSTLLMSLAMIVAPPTLLNAADDAGEKKSDAKNVDPSGTWQFVIEAQGNVFEPKLIVSKDGDKYKVAYNSPMLGKDDQPEIEKFRIEKNELMFTINVSFNGNDMKLDYKGRTYGDKIKGSIDLNSGTAELEFEGKRESKKK